MLLENMTFSCEKPIAFSVVNQTNVSHVTTESHVCDIRLLEIGIGMVTTARVEL